MARTISQILFFLLLAVVLVGAFCSVSLGSGAYLTCSLGMLQLMIGSQQLIWGTIVSGVVLLGLTMLLGRVFCGWICPFGAVLDWLQKPLERVRLAKSQIPAFLASTDNQRVKYGVLGGVLAAAAIVKYPAFCAACPVGTVCRTAGLQGINMGAETTVLPLIAGLETVRKRFWCKTLCPIGALLGLFSKWSPLKIRLPLDNCAGCRRCEQACDMDNAPRNQGYEKMKSDPAVIKALVESGVPDALDRPGRSEQIPPNVRRIVEDKNKRLTVNPLECTRCCACLAACPVLNGCEIQQPALHNEGRSTAG
jgi:ferredoxin-type protein NapH